MTTMTVAIIDDDYDPDGDGDSDGDDDDDPDGDGDSDGDDDDDPDGDDDSDADDDYDPDNDNDVDDNNDVDDGTDNDNDDDDTDDDDNGTDGDDAANDGNADDNPGCGSLARAHNSVGWLSLWHTSQLFVLTLPLSGSRCICRLTFPLSSVTNLLYSPASPADMARCSSAICSASDRLLYVGKVNWKDDNDNDDDDTDDDDNGTNGDDAANDGNDDDDPGCAILGPRGVRFAFSGAPCVLRPPLPADFALRLAFLFPSLRGAPLCLWL
jgi:hypothetical protein